MANLKEVRTRIASVSSTQQITSAMKMVSAAKFRRAQVAIMGMRPYAAMLNEIIESVDVEDGVSTPYHEVRKSSKVILVVVTSNKGLCGGFNANVLKEANAQIDRYRKQGVDQLNLITIGRKATELFSKQEGLVLESHDELLDNPTFDEISALAESLMNGFREKRYDKIVLVYNQFKNSLTQILSAEQFLPVRPQQVGRGDGQMRNDYIFEPSKEEILREMVPQYLRAHFYRVILDSLAAEHGARMTAMQKATDNATELLKELRLTYNKARQTAITNEIIEIVSGSEALKN